MPISCTPLRILATGRALPSQRVSSAELDRALNLPAGSFQVKSRIQHRYYAADDESQSLLAARAVLLGTAAGMSLGGLVLDH